MEEKSDKKKKKEKSFIEEFLFMMMQSVLKTALNSFFDSLFEELGFKVNQQQWIDEYISDAAVEEMLTEASEEMYEAFNNDLQVF